MSFGRKTIDFLALNRGMAGLLTMVILVGMGERMAERFLPLYLLALGGTAVSVGALNGLNNLLSALYSFPGGYLSDRLGTKRALALFNLMAMAGYLIVILIPRWQAVLAGSVLFIAWTAISLPAVMSLVARVIPKSKRTMGVTLHSLVRRIPMALGPIVGGLLIDHYGAVVGVRLAFGGALLMAILATVVQWHMLPEDRHEDRQVIQFGAMLRHLNPSLRNLLVSDILVRFAEQIPYAFVVVWVVQRNGISSFHFGVLTAIEMATAVLIYLPVAWLADRSTKKPFVVITFGFFTLFPAILLISHSFAMLVVAFIIRGLKEFGEPTRKALIMDLAPENAKAGTFGVYYLIRDIIVSVAAFGGAFLWNMGAEVNFLIAAACGAIGTIYFALFGRDLPSLSKSH